MFHHTTHFLLAAALLLATFLPAETHAQEQMLRPVVVLVSLEDQLLHPITQRFLTRSLRQAAERGASCVIIQLDTAGGLLRSTQHIVRAILTSDVPVVVYIAPSKARATSMGIFIPLAAHVAAMAPDTTIGAAHPVSPIARRAAPDNQDGNEPSTDLFAEKVTNDVVAWARALAHHRHRNIDWAATAVQDGIAASDSEARLKNVIDLQASDLNDLLRQLNNKEITLSGRTVLLHTEGALVERLEMSWPERLFSQLANPTLAYLLLLLGFSGLMMEITHPGAWIPGILGLVCLILAFIAMLLLPINLTGLGLIVLALTLIVLEVKVPSYGILTAVGILNLLLGSALLVEPVGGVQRVPWVVVAPVSITIAIIMLVLVRSVVRAHRAKVQTGMACLIGTIGHVRGEMNGEGYVFVAGELWKARSDLPLQDGEAVRIQSYEGLTLYVKPVAGP